eukprot:gene9610-biopygen1692
MPKGKTWWLLNMSLQEIGSDTGQRLVPGGMIHCALSDEAGWSGEQNKDMRIAIIWREESHKTKGAELLWATNTEGLSNEKMKWLEKWADGTGAFAVALSEVRRLTGRRRIGKFQAHWTLDPDKHAGVGLLLSATATSQLIGKPTELMKGRILKVSFAGNQGQWTLLAVYAPQSRDRETSRVCLSALEKEIKQHPSVILLGDFNATPTAEGRDGPATKGDVALHQMIAKYNLQDMGPSERTFHHIRKEDGTILSSSRIDLVLGTPTAHTLIQRGSGHTAEVPWNTSHKGIHVKIDSSATFSPFERKLKFKRPLPKPQTEAAQQYAEELDKRAHEWPKLETHQYLPKEYAALEMWADMWLHTAHMSGVQARKGGVLGKQRTRTEDDEGYIHEWGF